MAIEARDVSIRYPDRARPALHEVTETIERGEAVVLTGPSGCGKTTLCRAISGFIPELIPACVQGDLRVGDLSVWDADPARLAAWVGLVQQDPDAQICTLGVRQEVAFGPENLCLSRDEIDDRVDRALVSVGIEHLRDRETTTLSGGEKQRLAIASILAMEPEVLVLDEPTAHLDPAGARQLFDLLLHLQQRLGLTLLIVEHRARPLAALSPRTLVLDEGRVVPRSADRHRFDPPKLTSAAPFGDVLVRVRELAFAYDAPLLRDVSFDLRQGEVLGVIGPNGGGKTTLLRLLAGLERPETGSIDRRAGDLVGFVFQHPHHQIFERTVHRELTAGMPSDDDSVDAWLKEGRLDRLGEAAPLSLSLGEQRRLTLITALRRRPSILLLDEPFIGQDRRNVEWIVARIREQATRGGGVVLVSHDIGLVAALCDRLLFLAGSAVYGEPPDVFGRLRSLEQGAFLPGFWEESP